MLTISKPLSSGQAQTYHAKEFTSAEQNYWKQGDAILGEWQGQLAEKFGLAGAIDAQAFRPPERRPEPPYWRTTGPASEGPGVHNRRRNHRQAGRAPGRMGCDVFRSQICFADRACWRR